MSSIVAGIINLVTGALLNKLCDYTAEKLKEGDLTEEKCREMIIRELDDIKSKLDGLARKDLLSSVSFLSDGVCLLNLSLEQSIQAVESSCANKQKRDNNKAGCSALVDLDDSMRSNGSVSEALTLSQTAQSLATEKRFVSAKLSFEKAYTKATEAFNNEALGIGDRILAAKLRVISKILECLEDADAAVAFCKLYLQQLHDLPAVRKTFSVYFRSGMRSRFNKMRRTENIGIVMMINYVLYDYTKMFARSGPGDIFTWPKIKLTKRTFNPLLVESERMKKLEKSAVYPPNQFGFSESKETENLAKCAVVNSKRDVILLNNGGKRLEIINKKGEVYHQVCLDEKEARGFELVALATDAEDDLFIISRFKATDKFNYNLSVSDTEGNVKQQVPLDYLTGPGESHHAVCIAASGNGNIVITKQDEPRVYVLDSTGQVQRDFGIDGWHLIKYLAISAHNDIIVSELVGKTVSIYTEDGIFKQNVVVPGLHKVCGLAYDHTAKTILVLTDVMPGGNYQLESYSETGEQLQSSPLPGKHSTWCNVISHPRGTVAVVHKAGVLYLCH